jgi:2,4-dienoyl-CoA reductase-like NADH-dependent reductase (Old Yellow Enzyme family)
MVDPTTDMVRNSAFPHVLAPISVRRTRVRNRVVITAHGASDLFRDPALNPESYIEYLRRRAGGGAGMIIVQPLLANPDGEIPESIVERHARLVEIVKPEGATLLIQLVNLGAYGRTDAMIGRSPSWSFDEQQSDAGESSHKMTDAEVDKMVDAYRRAARMFADVGFDGVEVHGGHGYLIQQSLTPRTNRRSDRWGLDRTLFARSVLEVVRDELGPDRLLCYRTSTDDLINPADGGRGLDGIAEDLTSILKTGCVDLLNTTMGDGGKSYVRSIPGYRHPEAPNVGLLSNLRRMVDIDVPVVATGGIVSLEVAEQVLQTGVCDLVAMTRAHIADPEVVNKAVAGQRDRIRPCVRSNMCVDRKQALFPEIGCFHNPEVLREVPFAPRPAGTPRHVLVVGAGPAGLKAAETAARCGHRVDLVDAATNPGGRLLLARNTPAAELCKAIDHLVAELGHIGVAVQLGRTADESLIASIGPDAVILATGSAARVPASLAQLEGVVASDDALTDEVLGTVVVYDELGTSEAALVAETLRKRSAGVHFATRFETVVPFAGQMQRWEVPDLLYASLDGVHTARVITGRSAGSVELTRLADRAVTRVPADVIVTVSPPSPRTALVPVMQRLGIPYHVVGDANAPRTAWQAFNEGHLAALAL